MLSYIATVSGGLGFRLILATQYPTVTSIPSVVKQMSDAKLGFRLPTYKASEVVLDESGLETLPSLPGRAIYKTDRLTEPQVPFISDEMMWEHLKQYEVKKMNIQTHIKINRQMTILTSIRKLKFATRRHLMAVHDMGGIRNANRILKDLSPYVNNAVYQKEYVYYLNKRAVNCSTILRRLYQIVD